MDSTTIAQLKSAYIVPGKDGLLGCKVQKMRVANNQTLAAGDFVILSGGLVTLAKGTATASTDFATDVFGITQDAVANSGTGSTTYVNVQIINENTRLIGNYLDNTVFTVATGAVRLITAPGLNLSLYNIKGTWGLGAIPDATVPTQAVAVGLAMAPQDDQTRLVGVQGGRIIFKIKSSILE